MCGITGYIDLKRDRPADQMVLKAMTESLSHRGPDSYGYFVDNHVGYGFCRLSIIDLENGQQPMYNEDASVVMVCNGELYNYREAKRILARKGHVFQTQCDVEIIPHLYEEQGIEFVKTLNGQFAFALYDKTRRKLYLVRDHFGILPLFYTVADDYLIFGSEIKAILKHPAVQREIDFTGLDQILSFPGLVSPRTLFKGIRSLPCGQLLEISNGKIHSRQYWDLEYPSSQESNETLPESYYVEGLKQHLVDSVRQRLQADVPVGLYLSGGLDSSLIAGILHRESLGAQRHSFSIQFSDKMISETPYQVLMSKFISSIHHTREFGWQEIENRLSKMVYFSECPVKETYNVCSLALSETARDNGVPVVLTGEGADELFGGYIGYRFDQYGRRGMSNTEAARLKEDSIRMKLWGNKNLFYEKDQHEFVDVKRSIYSSTLNQHFDQFNCLNHELVSKAPLKDRHIVHQRSYLDFKLRLADHLLSDHGDRMSMAHSVEARYPFLDLHLVEFTKQIPPTLKVRDYTEKYILKKASLGLVPTPIIKRQKFGFRAPGSPYLLRQNTEWINDLLSYDRIKRQGYFDPEVIEKLKSRYTTPGFTIHPHLDTDLILVVLTFNLWLDIFDMPSLN